MFYLNILLLTFQCLLLTSLQKSSQAVENWISPYPSIPEYIPNEQTDQGDYQNLQPQSLLTHNTEVRHICNIDNTCIPRWLKKLVLKIEKESNLVPSAINFPIDTFMLKNLKELSTAKSLEISQLDELICKMIEQSSVIRREDFDWTILFDYAKDIVCPIAVFVLLTVCIYTIYQGILIRPAFTTLCCVVASSVFWHWMHLYKQRQAERLAELVTMTMPAQCRKYELGLIEHFHEYLKSFFTNNECTKYYEALTIDPFWEVSITVAISEAATSMLFQPLSTSSRYLNLAIKQLIDGLTIFTIIPLLMFLFLILIMLCNYRVKLPLLMGALEPNPHSGGSRVQELKSLKPQKTIKDTRKSKIPSKDIGVFLQKSLVQGTEAPTATMVLKKCRNKGCIQNILEEQCVHSEFKVSPIGRINLRKSAIRPFVEESTSEDDISIIDSDENLGDTEESLLERIPLLRRQNRQGSFSAKNKSNTGFKVDGSNMGCSFHFSPDGDDRGDNEVK